MQIGTAVPLVAETRKDKMGYCPDLVGNDKKREEKLVDQSTWLNK